eukprot:scaffold2805_cov202-Prasinococcus_capsulatus_cf.AAC.5
MADAMEFVIPLEFCDLQNQRDESARQLFVREAIPVEQAEQQLRRIVFELCEQDALCIAQQQKFDEVYSLVGAFDSLSNHGKQQLLDCLASNLSMLTASLNTLLSVRDKDDDALSSMPQQRTALKVYCYFVAHLAINCSASAAAAAATSQAPARTPAKKKKTSEFDYEQHREKVRALTIAPRSPVLTNLPRPRDR